jgi:beta-phosphoglucomutase-like phosphatase (HAD superfamily)
MALSPAGCVAVEDTPRGLRAAQAAGMRTLAVPSDLTADQDFTGASRCLASLDALTPELLRALEAEG